MFNTKSTTNGDQKYITVQSTYGWGNISSTQS